MKQIILGSILSMINFSTWSACTYNFDATNQDLSGTEEYKTSISTFSNISGNKFSYKTQLGTSAHIALSKKMIKKLYKNPTVEVLSDGDKYLPNTGIQAFELEMKVPEITNPKTMLNIFPILIGGEMENGDYLLITPTYQKHGTTNEFYISGLQSGDFKMFNPIKFEPHKITSGYQNIAIYLNQNTQQVGVIANGVNKGYVFSYRSKLKNIYFGLASNYTEITSSDINKELSIELITDAVKLKNNYPTGTTDICGTKI